MAEHSFKLPDEASLSAMADSEMQEEIRRFFSNRVMNERVRRQISDAFHVIELQDLRVSDVVMGPNTFSVLRRYIQDYFDPSTNFAAIRAGLVGNIYGARVWVQQNIDGVICFSENSPEFSRRFPQLAEAYRNLVDVPAIQVSIEDVPEEESPSPRLSRYDLLKGDRT